MPTARSGIAAAVLEGRMFVFGGAATTGTLNQAEAYDARSNGWSSHARYADGDTASAQRRSRAGITSSDHVIATLRQRDVVMLSA